jgi:hypothetical protein
MPQVRRRRNPSPKGCSLLFGLCCVPTQDQSPKPQDPARPSTKVQSPKTKDQRPKIQDELFTPTLIYTSEQLPLLRPRQPPRATPPRTPKSRPPRPSFPRIVHPYFHPYPGAGEQLPFFRLRQPLAPPPRRASESRAHATSFSSSCSPLLSPIPRRGRTTTLCLLLPTPAHHTPSASQGFGPLRSPPRSCSERRGRRLSENRTKAAAAPCT